MNKEARDLEQELQLLRRAIGFRAPFCEEPHRSSFRLVNGFTEGLPDLAIDVFARTMVMHDYSAKGLPAAVRSALMQEVLTQLSWIDTVILKRRAAATALERNGVIVYGATPAEFICEHGVEYAVDLVLNQDNSFYNDTRLLRKYLLENMSGRTMLNTFAYTGSLGCAALAGGAAKVVQTDLSGKFLRLAEATVQRNHFAPEKMEQRIGNFFPVVSKLRREQAQFDCVVLDPPLFSQTPQGTVDLVHAPVAVINKVRPLVADGGVLVVVNNALFLSGKKFLEEVDAICDGIWLRRGRTIPVPEDYLGFNPEAGRCFSVDPQPFTHSTKMILLHVRRRDSFADRSAE
ncbi:MAG: class I SAM-dependent methyltransferase [Victivallaceae bacterium]|nr:class I SAM-dependent methyltransferase [Victivallaceae bacterium]